MLWEKCKEQIHANDKALVDARKKKAEATLKYRELRDSLRQKEISEDTFEAEVDKLAAEGFIF